MLLLPLSIALTAFFWGLFIEVAPDLTQPIYQFLLYMAAMASNLWVLHEAIDMAFETD